MATNNREIVGRLLEDVWQGRNADLLDQLCAPGCTFYDVLKGSEPMDVAGEKDAMRIFDRAFSLEEFSYDLVAETPDTAVFSWSMRTTMHGPLESIESTGRSAHTSGVGILRLANGKIVEHRSVWDTLTFFQGLGLLPRLGEQQQAWAGASQPQA